MLKHVFFVRFSVRFSYDIKNLKNFIKLMSRKKILKITERLSIENLFLSLLHEKLNNMRIILVQKYKKITRKLSNRINKKKLDR